MPTSTIIFSGMIAGDPGHGGATWAVLQYLLGFRRLGHRVWFVEPIKAAKIRPVGAPFAESDKRGRAAIAEEIDAFNAVARRYATHSGAAFVDVTEDSRRAAQDRNLLTSDSLHPSALMYRSWAQLILPEALRALDA